MHGFCPPAVVCIRHGISRASLALVERQQVSRYRCTVPGADSSSRNVTRKLCEGRPFCVCHTVRACGDRDGAGTPPALVCPAKTWTTGGVDACGAGHPETPIWVRGKRD